MMLLQTQSDLLEVFARKSFEQTELHLEKDVGKRRDEQFFQCKGIYIVSNAPMILNYVNNSFKSIRAITVPNYNIPDRFKTVFAQSQR